MNILGKFGVYFLLFIPATLVAGFYGAIHDQISYSLSNEYFTHFKFIQFGFPWAQESPRLAAALVGMLATWWMGVLVFVVLGLFGFAFPTSKIMAIELLKSFGIVIVVAFVTGVIGLAYGYIQVNDATVSNYAHWIWPGVTNPVQFVRVGFMHNASYLGGILGLCAGIAYLFLSRKKQSEF